MNTLISLFSQQVPELPANLANLQAYLQHQQAMLQALLQELRHAIGMFCCKVELFSLTGTRNK